MPAWNQVSLFRVKLPAELMFTGLPRTSPLMMMLSLLLVIDTPPLALITRPLR